MRITFNIPEFTRNERNSHCDVLHIAPVRVANLVLDDAIAAIQIKAYGRISFKIFRYRETCQGEVCGFILLDL